MRTFRYLLPIVVSAVMVSTAIIIEPGWSLPVVLAHIVFCGYLGWRNARR